MLLAERDGGPVGYVSAVRRLHLWTGGDVLALDDLYVRPGHRDAGIGRRLMAALAALAEPGAAAHHVGHGGGQRRRPALLPTARRDAAAQGPGRVDAGRLHGSRVTPGLPLPSPEPGEIAGPTPAAAANDRPQPTDPSPGVR